MDWRARFFQVFVSICLGLGLGWSSAQGAVDDRDRCGREVALQALEAVAWEHFGSYGRSFHDGGARFSTDAVSRGLYIRQMVGEQAVSFDVVRPEHSSGHRGRLRKELPATLQVVHRGHPVRGMAAIPSSEFNNVFYASLKDVENRPFPNSEKKPSVWLCEFCGNGQPEEVHYRPFAPRETSKVMWSAKHGWTAPYSQGFRMKGALEVVNASAGENRIARYLASEGLFFESTAIAYDQPFHGAGRPSSSMRSLGGLMDYERSLDAYWSSFGMPYVELARSGSTMTAAYRNFQYDLLGLHNPLRAMIWMAPVHPQIGVQQSCKTLHGYTKQCLETVGAYRSPIKWNPLSFSWFRSIVEQMNSDQVKWWQSEHPLGKKQTPTLILVGENDLQTSEETRAFYRELASRFPDFVEYHEIKGGDHDLLSTTESYSGAALVGAEESAAVARAKHVWALIYRFLRKHIPEISN